MSNMAVQMNYGEPSRGMPGGLYDRAEYEAVTRRNSAEDKALCFGYGVVQGAEPGKDIALPATDVTADKFEGVVMYSANTEMDDDGASPASCGCSWSIRWSLPMASPCTL